jgi:hypothetical protein
MAQQTAVEWFKNEIPEMFRDDPYWRKLLEQAKAMEKEQIMNAYRTGWINYLPKKDSEEYYNETYQSNQVKADN